MLTNYHQLYVIGTGLHKRVKIMIMRHNYSTLRELSLVTNNPSSSRAVATTLVVCIVAGIALRLAQLTSDTTLWMDEIFSVTLAESSLLDLILAVPRFDTHPPLYYIQLKAWHLMGSSDSWYVLNSVLLSISSLAALFFSCRAHYGFSAAAWSTAILAVLPLQLFFAENVRMYAMFAILQILLWHTVEYALREKRASIRLLAAALGLGWLITMTHGLGFFVCFFIFIRAGFWIWYTSPRWVPKKKFYQLAGIYFLVALASAYPLAIGIFRKTEGVTQFDLPAIGTHLTLAILGLQFPFPEVAGLVALLLVVAILMQTPQSRDIGFFLVLLPFSILLFASLQARPVFLYRTLGLFLPFLALGLGIAASRLFADRNRFRDGIAIAALAVLIVAGINYSVKFKKAGYKDVILAWQDASSRDAVLVTVDLIDFWAALRYLENGANKLSALEVQPPVRDGMIRLRDQLKDTMVDRMGFFGRSQFAQVGQRRIYIQPDNSLIFGIDRIWFLNPLSTSCDPELLPRRGERAYIVTKKLDIGGQTAVECTLQ